MSRDKHGAEVILENIEGECDDKASSLDENIRSMYELKVKTDVKIHFRTLSQEVCFEAHKRILKTRSSVFATMLGKLVQSSSEDVTVVGVTGRGFEVMLRYIYSNKLETESVRELIEAAKAARRFEVDGLVQTCKSLLDNYPLDNNNVFSVLEASKYFKMETISANCMEYIKTAPQAILFETPGLLEVSRETMLHILTQRDISEESEFHVIIGVIRWLDHKNCRDRSLLSNIRTFSLTCDEFLEVLERFPSFFTYREKTCILSNITRPGFMELPPWCQANFENHNDYSLISSTYDNIAERSLQVKTDCNIPFRKSHLYGSDGFDGSVTFEMKLSRRFGISSHLVMMELAFGSSFVPEGNLKLELFRYEQGSNLKKIRVGFSLQATNDNYYIIINNRIKLENNYPFVFNLKLRVSGLRGWCSGMDAPVSNGQYRAAQIPENIFYNMCLNVFGRQSVCLTPLSDWLVFLDPSRGEKRLLVTSFYIDPGFKDGRI